MRPFRSSTWSVPLAQPIAAMKLDETGTLAAPEVTGTGRTTTANVSRKTRARRLAQLPKGIRLTRRLLSTAGCQIGCVLPPHLPTLRLSSGLALLNFALTSGLKEQL